MADDSFWNTSSGSGLIGGALDTIIGPVMANQSYIRSKHVSNRGMAATAKLARESPSWAVEGLRNAGLNPILAVSKGFSGGSDLPRQGQSPVTSSRLGAAAASAAQMRKLAPEVALLKEQERNVRNQADAAFYDVGGAESRAERDYQAKLVEEQRVKQVEETVNLLKEQQNATAQQARASKVNADLAEKQIPAAKALEELYEEYPELKKWSQVLKDIWR